MPLSLYYRFFSTGFTKLATDPAVLPIKCYLDGRGERTVPSGSVHSLPSIPWHTRSVFPSVWMLVWLRTSWSSSRSETSSSSSGVCKEKRRAKLDIGNVICWRLSGETVWSIFQKGNLQFLCNSPMLPLSIRLREIKTYIFAKTHTQIVRESIFIKVEKWKLKYMFWWMGIVWYICMPFILSSNIVRKLNHKWFELQRQLYKWLGFFVHFSFNFSLNTYCSGISCKEIP